MRLIYAVGGDRGNTTFLSGPHVPHSILCRFKSSWPKVRARHLKGVLPSGAARIESRAPTDQHVLSLRLHSKMNRCSMSDAKRVYEPLGIFASGRSDCIAQRVTQKVLARNWLNGNKLIQMRDIQRASDRIKDRPRRFGNGFSFIHHSTPWRFVTMNSTLAMNPVISPKVFSSPIGAQLFRGCGRLQPSPSPRQNGETARCRTTFPY